MAKRNATRAPPMKTRATPMKSSAPPMKKSVQPIQLFQDPFSHYIYWLRWWEMMAASTVTIGLRLSGISYKLHKNQRPDLREMWRMGEEKHTAALQSFAALPKATAGLNFLQQQSEMQEAMFRIWRPFYQASTANAFRLSGTRKPQSRK